MASPAVQAAIEAVLAKLEAIVPTIDPGSTFRRQSENSPSSTKAGKRLFDVDFEGIGREQPFGRDTRVATVQIKIDYPVGRAERALEAVLAQDSEDIVRSLMALGAWSKSPVIKVQASTSVDRAASEPQSGQGRGVFRLIVAIEITYHDPQ